MLFQGSYTALATPFAKGEVDEAAFVQLCEWQIAEGTQGLIACGTTGESPTLTDGEHKAVISAAVRAAKGRAKVLAGVGSNSTAEAIALSQYAERAGADGLLHVNPYYNKPTQEGMYQHFKAIAAAVRIPILLYNIPGRTSVDMSPETMKRLAAFKNIVGVKDATANLQRVTEQRLACGPDFIQLSGDDFTALGFNFMGGHGCVSVASNVAPRLCADLQRASLAGDYTKALSLHDRLFPLFKALFVETSPSPVKYALSLLGHGTDEVRLPLVPASDSCKAQVKAAMEDAGLI